MRTKYGSGGTARSVTTWLSQTVYAAMAAPVSKPQTMPGHGLPWVARGDQEMRRTPATTSSTPTPATTPGRSPSTVTATANVSSGPVPRASG